jgi:hypothetical protein
MIHEIKIIKQKVKLLLEEFPHLRESDEKLIANIWFSQLEKDKKKTMTAFDFLSEFANGNFASPESIRRSRAKVQEQNENLRGANYKARKKEEEEVRNEINKI